MKSLVSYLAGCTLALFATNAVAVPTVSIVTAPTQFTVSYGALNTAVQLQYTVVSNLPNKSQTLSKFVFASATPSSNVSVSSFSNTCGGVLPPQGGTGVCTINVNLSVSGVQPPGHTALASAPYRLEFLYGNGRDTKAVSRPVSIQFADGDLLETSKRRFVFENYCDYDVWFGIASGATNSIKPDPATPTDLQSCATDSDCYPGSVCVTVQSHLKHCFWKNPEPDNRNYKLVKHDGSKPGRSVVVFPVYNNGIDAVWSGGIDGRTKCTAASCDTGDCNSPTSHTGHDGACKIATGFAAPVSTAEFTLLGNNPLVYTNTPKGNSDVDTYDVTVINGITTPISMTPANGKWGGASSPYVCGSPGARSSDRSSATCLWDSFVVPSKQYVFVKYQAGAASCASQSCSVSGEVCGSSFNPTGSHVLVDVCGIPLGYWTADAICAKDASFLNSSMGIHCAGALDAPDASYNQAELYGCSTGIFHNSCYSNGAVSGSCCGCVDWNTLAGNRVPAPPVTASCNGIKTDNWTNLSQPKLTWLKQACPSAYVYPYDDASSTFTCQALNKEKENNVQYIIRFCPRV